MRAHIFGCFIVAVFFVSVVANASSPIAQISPSDLKRILENEKGHVVVLNLWATWCAPCLVEIPDLLRLEEKMSSDNVKLMGISVDEPTFSTKHIEQMRDKRFPAFHTYARDNRETDYLVSVVDPAWNEVVPTTYIIDRDGVVRERIQGKKSLAEFKAAVLAVMK